MVLPATGYRLPATGYRLRLTAQAWHLSRPVATQDRWVAIGKDGVMGAVSVRGGVPLQGSVTVRGAKNLVPKAMVAALLAPGSACCATCRTWPT